MSIGKPLRGSTGGTPGYGTQGGYSQSKPANRSSFSGGGLVEPLYGLVLLIIDWRADRRAVRT